MDVPGTSNLDIQETYPKDVPWTSNKLEHYKQEKLNVLID